MKHRIFRAVMALALLTSPLLSLEVRAHWEFRNNQQFLFGYTGVESANEYPSEVANNGIKTNITTLSSNYNSLLGSAITHHNNFGNKVAIFLDTILFDHEFGWNLRPDYQYLFNYWYNRNKLYLTPDRVAILIINSEANNRDISNAELNQATAFVKTKLPAIPTIVGYGLSPGGVDISAQTLPTAPDGFAFWSYYVQHPEAAGSRFQYWLNYFKTHIDTSRQRLLIVFDAHFASGHLAAGMTQEALGPVAIRYANIVKNDPLIVGMVGFTWEGFGDILGLRDVTQSVRNDNRTASCILLPCL